MLTTDEVTALLALGIPVDARHVPDDEIRRALAERRVQYTFFDSWMAESSLHWEWAGHDSRPELLRDLAVVLPPGHRGLWPDRANSLDDRDIVGRLWEPFWSSDQRTALVRCIPAPHHDAMLEECARMLVELEQRWRWRGKAEDRAVLLDWLVAAKDIDRETLSGELAARDRKSTRHLARGVRARWLDRDVAAAHEAVTESAGRFCKAPRFDRTEQHAARLALLRFGVRLVRSAADT